MYDVYLLFSSSSFSFAPLFLLLPDNGDKAFDQVTAIT
jgi:hypothetical protein